MRFRFHHNPTEAGAGPLLCAEHILNPMTGRYTVTDDLEAVAPLVVALADRYAEYENDGETVWDRTVNVRKRPAWLREAANVNADGQTPEEKADAVEIDLFAMSAEENPEEWEGNQAALNIAWQNNKQGVEWQQLDAMRQRLALQSERIEQQHAEQQRQHSEYLHEQASQAERNAQRIEQQRAEQLRDQAEQLEELQRLQEKLIKQHAEQQQAVTSAISASGGECLNDNGECNPTPACFAEA